MDAQSLRRAHAAALYLALVGAILFIKKMIVAQVQARLLIFTLGGGEVAASFIQEVVLAGLLALALRWLAPTRSWKRWVAWLLAANLLLLAEWIDWRVRILFMKPLGWGLLTYGLKYASNLRSSSGVFFDSAWLRTGLWLFAGLNALPWLAALSCAGFASWRRIGARTAPRVVRIVDAWTVRVGLLALVLALMVLRTSPRGFPVWLPGHRDFVVPPFRLPYQIQDDLALEPIWALGEVFQGESARAAAERCRQKLRAFTPDQHKFQRTTGRPELRGCNVVFYVLESVGLRRTGLGGAGPQATPVLDRLAAEGLSFAPTYALIPHSSKSLYSLFTGCYASPTIEGYEAAASETPSLPGALRKQGYQLFYFYNGDLDFDNQDHLLHAMGFETLIDNEAIRKILESIPHPPLVENSWGIEDRALVASRLVDRLKKAERFCAVFWNTSTHHPYLYPGKAKPRSMTYDYGRALDDYRAALHYADAVLGELIEQFKAAGLAERTIFVIVGDHGESFGEHGEYMHQNSLYEEEVAVPLVLLHPALRGLPRPKGFATQLDIVPTLLDLLGLDDVRLNVQGDTLFNPERSQRVYLSSWLDDVRLGVVEGRSKSIYSMFDGRVFGFDLARDPAEKKPRVLAGGERARLIADLLAYRAYNRRRFTAPP